MDIEITKEFLDNRKIRYQENFELYKKSWIKAGGIIKLYIQPKNEKELIGITNFFSSKKINFLTLGNLSNTLFRDGEIFTPVINLKLLQDITVKDENDKIFVKASSGLSIYKFVQFIQKKYFISGMEGMVGIPGSLGGAVITNASSYGSCISDYLSKVEYINFDNTKKILNKFDINFGWRKSIFQNMNNFVITNLYFEISKKKIVEYSLIEEKQKKIEYHRKFFQESKYPNLGSLYATKNLYKDISFCNIFLFFCNLFRLFLTKISYLFFNEKKLIKFRKHINQIYKNYFKISKYSGFSLSDKTINCLINTGSRSSTEAFEIIAKIEKKISGKAKLENVLYRDIK